MPHEVREGQQFKLLGLTWQVSTYTKYAFQSFETSGSGHRHIYLQMEDADSLDWLEPKKKVDEFMEWLKSNKVDFLDMRAKLIQLFGDV